MVYRHCLIRLDRPEIHQHAIYRGQVFDHKHFRPSGLRSDFEFCMTSTYNGILSGMEVCSSHDEFIAVLSRLDRQDVGPGARIQGDKTGRQNVLHLDRNTETRVREMRDSSFKTGRGDRDDEGWTRTGGWWGVP